MNTCVAMPNEWIWMSEAVMYWLYYTEYWLNCVSPSNVAMIIRNGCWRHYVSLWSSRERALPTTNYLVEHENRQWICFESASATLDACVCVCVVGCYYCNNVYLERLWHISFFSALNPRVDDSTVCTCNSFDCAHCTCSLLVLFIVSYRQRECAGIWQPSDFSMNDTTSTI